MQTLEHEGIHLRRYRIMEALITELPHSLKIMNNGRRLHSAVGS